MSETDIVIEAARALRDVQVAADPGIDYAGVNQHHPKQRAALTRAKNSGDHERIRAAVIKAVREWKLPPYNGHWPDDWANWQAALNDTLHWNDSIDLRDIR